MKLMQTDKSDAKGKKTANLKKKLKPVRKQKGKQKAKPKDSDESEDEGIKPLKETRVSDEPIPRKSKWTNRQRVLVLCARGINHRDRHLMRDLRTLMPHHRAEPKMERWKTLQVVNEMSEMKHCNKVMLFEGRRKLDLYMWLANVSVGPSVKFLVENIHTMGEMKMTGNCLRGSRPLLSFSEEFTKQPHLLLIKELLVQIFGVPNHHPKSQPFIDRVITFTYLDNRIWYRHFQILSEDGGLTEVGPRFVMNPIKIFSGSFGGDPIWENPVYQSPAKHRQMLRKMASEKYLQKTKKKVDRELNTPQDTHKLTPYGEIFKGGVEERVQEVLKQEKQRPKEEREREKLEKLQKLMKQRDDMRKLKLANAKKATKKRLPTKRDKMRKEKDESDTKEARKGVKKGARGQKGGKKKFDGKKGVAL